MADNEPQQALMVDRDLTLVNNISDSPLSSDFQQKSNEVLTTSDILQRAFDEAGGFDQTLLSRANDQNLTLQENIQHLTDHSYININLNTDTPTSSNNSQNLNSTYKDSNNQLELPNLQLSNDADLSSSHGLDSSFAEETPKPNLPVNENDKLNIVEDVFSTQILTSSTTSINSMPSNNLVIKSAKVISSPSILKTDSFSSNTPSSSLDSVPSSRIQMNLDNSLESFTNELPLKPSNSLGSVSSNESVSSDSVFPKDSNTSVQNLTNQSLQFILKQNIQTISSTPSSSNNTAPLKLITKQSNAPLGSVENPIQIIHNGTSYHSTQILTPEQLQQITHVLQQQHAKKLANGGKSSILFEPNTRTRIVCRVVHPSELQNKTSKPDISRTNSYCPIAGKGRGRPKAKDRSFEEDEKSMFTKEEREERKKHRPRTRSGRISKPPNHLAKDYKRIHPLDLNEEVYDDSDGGYSDYHVSDEESSKKESKSSNLPPGEKKNFFSEH